MRHIVEGRAINRTMPLTVGDASPFVQPGAFFRVNCRAAGDVVVVLEDESTETISVSIGYSSFPYRVKRVKATGTTAVANYANLHASGFVDARPAFLPSQLAGLVLAWWPSDRLDLITLQPGDKVSSWRDVIAGYDAAQAVDASRPIWSPTSFNGRPGVFFDGTDDELTLASVPFPSGADASEVWLAFEQDSLSSDTTARNIFSYGGTANGTRRAIVRDDVSAVNRIRLDVGDNSVAVPVQDLSVDASSRHVVRAQFGAAESTITIDGQATTAAVVPVTGTTRVRLGANTANTAGGFFNGILRDVIVTTATLTPEQVALLTTFLRERAAGQT